ACEPRRDRMPVVFSNCRSSLEREKSMSTTKPMSRARALIVPVTPFQQNCTLLWSEASKRAVVIDPGGDLASIERAIAQAGVTVEKIWLTHGHVDHASGAAELRERLRVPIEGPHRGDLFLLEHLVDSARAFGLTAARNVTPDRWLDE